MKQYLTPSRIANDIRLKRTLHKGAFLLVEGDTDARVFRRFIDSDNCNIVHAGGKEKALDALTILEKDNFQGILVIVDSDFWRLDGIKPGSMNLLLTDTHDLETMILSTPEVIEKALSEFGSTRDLKKLPQSVINMVLANALPIGYFRWLSSPLKDNLGLTFKNLPFEDIVDEDRAKFHVAIEKLIRTVKKNSNNVELDEKKVKARIEELLKNKNHDPWQVCSGHDMVQLFTIGFCFVFGNRHAKGLTAEILERTLRMAYEYTYFRLTRLHSAVEDWEKKNPEFPVFKH